MQVGAVFKQMRGKRMTQSMRRDGFFNMRFLLVRLDYLPKALTRHALAADVDKQSLLGGQRNHLRPYKFYVFIKRLDCSQIQWDKALFFRVGRTPYTPADVLTSLMFNAMSSLTLMPVA